MMSTWITKWWLFWPKVFKTALLNSHAWCLSRCGFEAGRGRVPLLSIWYQGLSTYFLHHGSQPSYVTSQDSKKCSQRQEVEAASLLGLACNTYIFTVYNVMLWYMYTPWNYYHNQANISITSQSYPFTSL